MSPVSSFTGVCSPDLCDTGEDLMKRGTPRIGGSVAGFIILVVVLVLIIIVAGSAVIYLLRQEGTSDGRRRSKQTRYPKQPTVAMPLVYDTGARSSRSLLSRLGKLLGIRQFTKSTRNGMQVHLADADGWIPARSGSDWSYPGSDIPHSASEVARSEVPKRTDSPSAQPRSILSGSSIPSPRHSSISSDSSLNVRFEVQGIRGLSYPDRFSPSPQPTLPSIHRQLSSPSSSHSSPQFSSPVGLRTTSPEPITFDSPRHLNTQGRQHSTQSGHSIVTFEGGTKFIEGL